MNPQHVQAQYGQSKKVYLQEQMKAHMDPVKLGLKREVREGQLGAQGGGTWDCLWPAREVEGGKMWMGILQRPGGGLGVEVAGDTMHILG